MGKQGNNMGKSWEHGENPVKSKKSNTMGKWMENDGNMMEMMENYGKINRKCAGGMFESPKLMFLGINRIG